MKALNKLFGGRKKDEEQAAELAAKNSLQTERDKIFPYFKQFKEGTDNSLPLPDDLSTIDNNKVYEAPSIQLVRRTVVEGLNLLYALDFGSGFQIIQENKLAEWGLTESQVYDIAVENFSNLLVNNLQVHGDANGVMLTVDGNLEAALVLVDDIWDQLEPQIGDTLVITVPARDVVMVTGEHNSGFLGTMRTKAREIYEKGNYPLSDLLYKRVNRKWEVFEKV